MDKRLNNSGHNEEKDKLVHFDEKEALRTLGDQGTLCHINERKPQHSVDETLLTLGGDDSLKDLKEIETLQLEEKDTLQLEEKYTLKLEEKDTLEVLKNARTLPQYTDDIPDLHSTGAISKDELIRRYR